jgi:hypothetical protein
MPKANKTGRTRGDRRARLTFAAGFRRAKRGNLWRVWSGITLSVFRGRGGYWWCAADGEGPRYSPTHYATEGEALAGLWEEVRAWRRNGDGGER